MIPVPPHLRICAATSYHEIVGWNDEGQALALDPRNGRVNPYVGTVKDLSDTCVTQIMPGTGFTVIYNPGTPDQFSESLFAWAVFADGAVHPMDCDNAGEVERLDTYTPQPLVMRDEEATLWLVENPGPTEEDKEPTP